MADPNAPKAAGVASADHQNGASAPPGQRRPYDYGGNPLARADTSESARLAAFGGELQPGLFKSTANRGFGNPAPLGLCAFALTTFLLSLLNMGARSETIPSIVIGSAFAYGGLVQLLAGMWEMAVGNTFGATALSSYGGFWISFAITLTPGGFGVAESYETMNDFNVVLGFYLMGWFIFTFLMLMCTLRSTLAFFLLFFFLDIAFLLLGIAYVMSEGGKPVKPIEVTGGVFACLSAFAAWYNALAGILDRSNSFFLIPVVHFPWSEKGREARGKPLAADKEAQD